MQSTCEYLGSSSLSGTNTDCLSDWHNIGQAPLVPFFSNPQSTDQYCHTVLVLGLCFFAGGIRFYEQGFDASAFTVGELTVFQLNATWQLQLKCTLHCWPSVWELCCYPLCIIFPLGDPVGRFLLPRNNAYWTWAMPSVNSLNFYVLTTWPTPLTRCP